MTAQVKPLLLSTQTQLMTYWPQIEPLLANAPVNEEFPPEAILQAALSAQMFMFAFVDQDENVEMVMVISPAPSVTLPTMNIITVAGKNLKQHVANFWEYFKGWCVMSGARAIDAYVPDRMEGFMEQLGLKRETVHVRLRL